MNRLFCLKAKNGLIKNDECYTYTHRQADGQDRLIRIAPCTHHGMKRLFCLTAENGLGRFAPLALPHY